jgi:serine/threonine protein kinase
MDLTRCPQERDLVAWVAGGTVPDSVRRHLDLDECGACKMRIDRLRAELSIIRDVAAGLPPQEEAQAAAAPADTEPVDCHLQEDFSEASSGISDEEDLPRPDRNGARPESIGRYRVVGELDSGGQASVYRAIHPTLPRDLAIKIAHRTSAIDRSLLRGDAELLCELDHPNLVRVYDLDIHEGRPFVAMEFVRGPNLRHVAQQSRPAPRQAAAWVAAIARALEYIHRKGVVHQDIKPSNIMLDESGLPRLIDFGMARWRHAWSDGRSGPSGGTLAFMAPEQSRGESERIGPSSDIFALGGVLYFLLTGQVPFEGQTRDEQWRRAMNCDFDRSALRTNKVSRRLENIVLKAMTANPSERYATAEAMARELGGLGRKQPGPIAWASLALLTLIISVGVYERLMGTLFSRWHSQSEPPRWAPTVTQGRPPSLDQIDEMVKVDRLGVPLDLKDALPLHTGDSIWIEGDLPPGRECSMFFYDSEGHLTSLEPITVERGPVRNHFVFPTRGAVPLSGPPGTELILIYASTSGPLRGDELQHMLPTGRALPPIPEQSRVVLDRETSDLRIRRKLGSPQPSAAHEAEARFRALRVKLATRSDFVAGVAFPRR